MWIWALYELLNRSVYSLISHDDPIYSDNVDKWNYATSILNKKNISPITELDQITSEIRPATRKPQKDHKSQISCP